MIRNIRSKMKILFKLVATFIIFQIITLLPLSAQAGENVWHLAASLGTAIDLLSSDVSDCCNATFTAINETEFTLSSKLDQYSSDFQDCCGTVDTKIDVARVESSLCCGIIDGGLNTVTSQPLIIVGSGTTINTPGYYCLTSDVALTTNSFIATNTNDVVLDLNSYTVSGGQGLSVLAGNNRITIQNGAIVS